LEGERYEKVVTAIAHEMSHIVLNGLDHPLREHEEAVDLTAMLLGYRDFYVAGAEYSETGPSRFLNKLGAEIKRVFSGDGTREYRWLGYLTPQEVCFAAKQMGRRWVHNPRPRPNGGIVALAGLVERIASLALALAVLGVVSFIVSFFWESRRPQVMLPVAGTQQSPSWNDLFGPPVCFPTAQSRLQKGDDRPPTDLVKAACP
jgi:hypothetical protein